MKKFLKIGKGKKSGSAETSSVGSAAGSSTIIVGYDIREKDLPKFHKAAWNGDLSKVKQLAKKDASPLDKENRTPLHLACTRGHAAIVEELIAWKAKLNKGDNASRTPLMKAVECHHIECASLLLEAKAEANNSDRDGNTSLHYAVQDGEVDLTKLLLGYGANPDIRNRLGYTPLHVAAIQKYPDVCQILLNADADIDITDEKRRTPLMHACHFGSAAIVQLFLSFQADTTIKDIKGWTAEDCAAIEGHHACSQLIQEATGQKMSDHLDEDDDEEHEFTPEPSPVIQRKPMTGLGAPAADNIDISEVDGSLSVATPRLDHLDSWDSEEESLGLGLRAKKDGVKVNLAKFVKGSDTEDSVHTSAKDTPRTKIPKRVDSDQKKVGFASPPQNVLTNGGPGQSKIPKAEKNLSQDSVQSDSWNDDESLGLGLGQPKKPTLMRQDQLAALNQDDTDVESADDNELPISDVSPVASKRTKHKDKDSKILNTSSAATKPENQVREMDLKRKAVMEELGFSDVSDVSDPEGLSELSSPRKRKSVESDWDDTMASESLPMKMTPRGERPLSGLSDWDTTVEDMTPRTPRGGPGLQRTISAKSEGSEWDSEVDDEPVQQAKSAIPQLASTEIKPPEIKQSTASDWDSTDAESPRHQTTTPAAFKLAKKISEDDAWDSDDDIEAACAPPVNATPPNPMANVKKPGQPSDEETEETISEWEVERMREKERKQREEEAEEIKRKIAAEVREAEEKERAERMRREQESEEEDRKRREAAEQLEWERIETEKKAEQNVATEKQIREQLKKEKESFELAVQKKLETQMMDIKKEEPSSTEKESIRQHIGVSGSFDHDGGIDGGSIVTEDHGNVGGGDDRTRQLQMRREKAEKDLEEARIRHYNRSLSHPSLNGSIDDDEDTYTSDVAPDSPRDFSKSRELTSPLGSYVHGVLGSSTPIPNNLAVNGDDGLSYTSTENEDSVQMKFTSAPRTPDIMNTSLNMNDSNSIMRTQEQLREYKRLLDKERSNRATIEHKKKLVDKDRAELQRKVDDLLKLRSSLEQTKVELDSKIRSLDYSHNEEVEKRKNAEVLLQKTKQQLARKEEQFTQELEAKQKIELSMRNMQLDLRTQATTIKQLEDEKDELARHLANERNARVQQERIMEENSRRQQAMNLETAKHSGHQAEVFSKLEAADEDRKTAMDTADKLKTELYAVKMELDRTKARQKDDHSLLSSENEDLQRRVDELKNDIKLNEEALAHASMQYNMQLNNLKTENALLTSGLEKEKMTREKTESELDSTRIRLNQASNELEKNQLARTELERNIQREREEWNRMTDRKDTELNSLKENNQTLHQRVGIAETKLSSVENELSVANTSLLERTAQLSNLQRELDQRRNSHENQEYALRKEKEDNAKLHAKLDGIQERLTSSQHECLTLKQQLDSYHNSSSLKERAAMDSQDKFAELLSTIRTDYDKTRSSLEEKNAHLTEQIDRYKEELRNAEMKRTTLEQEFRALQNQHNETVKRLAVAEAALESAKSAKDSIDSERLKLKQDIDAAQSKYENAQLKAQEYQSKIRDLVDKLDRTETSQMVTNQHLYQSAATAEADRQSRGDLENIVHKLEIENAKLEASLKHEMDRVEILQRDLQDSNKVRDTLEALVTNLRGSQLQLEDKLNEETANRSLFAQEAEDSRGLWETEVKSRSKLGLRIAQLERSKQESHAVAEEEKRRARKAAELKKVAETKMEALQEKNTDLQKEVATLRAHLKAAKKRLRELDAGESRINTLHSEFDRERLMMDSTLSTIRRQMDDIQLQLQQEIEKKEQLEGKNRQLQQELNALSAVDRAYQKLEKAKRKLDEEFAQYKAHVKSHYVERTELERVRQEYEVKARMEINHKLEEVNAYLEDQAHAREKLDQIRNTNDQQLRTDFEKKQRELQEELSRLRAGYQDVMVQKTTKDTEVQKLKDMYENEQKLREKLTNRLFKVNDVAANTKAMLSLERQRLRMSNPNIFAASAEANGFLSSPVGSGHQNPVFGMNNSDPLSHKIRNELNRSIAKHLEASPNKDLNLPVRAVDDTYLSSSFDKSSNDYLKLLRRNYLL